MPALLKQWKWEMNNCFSESEQSWVGFFVCCFLLNYNFCVNLQLSSVKLILIILLLHIYSITCASFGIRFYFQGLFSGVRCAQVPISYWQIQSDLAKGACTGGILRGCCLLCPASLYSTGTEIIIDKHMTLWEGERYVGCFTSSILLPFIEQVWKLWLRL